MSSIKNEIIKEIRDVVEIQLDSLKIRKCLDEYLNIKFGLSDVKYDFIRSCEDLVDIKFEDSDLQEMILKGYSIGGELVEEAILYELGANKKDRICVFYSYDIGTSFIGITIPLKIIFKNYK